MLRRRSFPVKGARTAEGLLLPPCRGHLRGPGLEIDFLFRKVRDQALATTNTQFAPLLYSSLSSESMFCTFAAPKNRQCG
jgi:hypothetical protein